MGSNKVRRADGFIYVTPSDLLEDALDRRNPFDELPSRTQDKIKQKEKLDRLREKLEVKSEGVEETLRERRDGWKKRALAAEKKASEKSVLDECNRRRLWKLKLEMSRLNRRISKTQVRIYSIIGEKTKKVRRIYFERANASRRIS